jgi:hypothetical protein
MSNEIPSPVPDRIFPGNIHLSHQIQFGAFLPTVKIIAMNEPIAMITVIRPKSIQGILSLGCGAYHTLSSPCRIKLRR